MGAYDDRSDRLNAHNRPNDAAGALGVASASLGGHAMLILRFALLCSLPGLLLPSPAAAQRWNDRLTPASQRRACSPNQSNRRRMARPAARREGSWPGDPQSASPRTRRAPLAPADTGVRAGAGGGVGRVGSVPERSVSGRGRSIASIVT